jgi:hypothetical protein
MHLGSKELRIQARLKFLIIHLRIQIKFKKRKMSHEEWKVPKMCDVLFELLK